uniref:Uncharacterized protein n=1 Tax=viral metagenome TaxID=1070528 RepID=A0A6M3KF02_9ZZZZ
MPGASNYHSEYDVIEEQFDPEGSGYDYKTAEKYGIKPDKTGHWQSREPNTGVLLKGRKHKTWPLTVQGEADAGYAIYKKNNRYYSKPIKK